MAAIESIQQTNGNYTLTIALGGNTTTLKNLKKEMVRPYIRRTLEKKLRAFVNHRERLMLRHGAYSNMAKYHAIEKIKRRLDQAPHWPYEIMLMQIERMREDLLLILPGRNSRFYNTHANLITELLNWVSSTRKGMAA